MFAANTVSGVSQGISLIAIPWYIANQLGRPSLYGLLYLIVTTLTLFWGPYAGTLVDKYDRKKVMISIQTVGLICVFSIAALGWYWQNTTLWMAAAIMIITKLICVLSRECVRNLDLRVQVHPGELWVSKQQVHIVLVASKSAVQKVMSQRSAGLCARCTRANAFPD